MDKNTIQAIKRLGLSVSKFGFSEKVKMLEGAEGEVSGNNAAIETESSLSRMMMGPVGAINGFHFPVDLIGGCCPRVAGEEEEISWNAAAEAADSERIKLVWQSYGDKIWYLAVRTADLASFPDTWCPFAALLPGMKDATRMPACYTYFSDESATMMTITESGLQIHRGTASVVR
ncbi:MAG: hypothetical protein PHX43_04365, partial [Alphaproteobacteria bacterium]|nr:hypothetical protein [Alphaproteobacteria bacterium]